MQIKIDFSFGLSGVKEYKCPTADNTVISLPSLSNVQYLTFLLYMFFLALEDNALAIFSADFGFSQLLLHSLYLYRF